MKLIDRKGGTNGKKMGDNARQRQQAGNTKRKITKEKARKK